MPALGVILLRGAIASGGQATKPEAVFRSIDEARLRLGLPPGDPGEAMYDAATRNAAERAEGARVVADARAELADTAALVTELAARSNTQDQRIRELERELADLLAKAAAEARTARAGAAEARVVAPTAEPAAVRALRARVAELQELLRDRNEQLAAARRTQARPAAPEASLRPSAAEDQADDGWEDNPVGEQPVIVPTWAEAGRAALARVPTHVAREALRTATELATGDRRAWRGVKRGKGLATPLLLARIGIHHRLLFRLRDDDLHTLEVVTREALGLALKRYAR